MLGAKNATFWNKVNLECFLGSEEFLFFVLKMKATFPHDSVDAVEIFGA